MTSAAPIRGLALFLEDLRYGSIPVPVRESVVDLVLSFFASAISCRLADDVKRVAALASALGGAQRSSVVNGAASSLAGAVLINGFEAAGGTDDRPWLEQIAAAVLPPALAIAEQRGSSGRDLLVSVAAGLETALRIGIGLGHEKMRERHWHPVAIVGPFGAAAAVGCLAGLDAAGFQNAISLAGTQSAGTFAHRGTPTMRFQQLNGGFSGFLAALLAEQGFQAKPEILTEARGGLFDLYSDGGDPQAVVEGLPDVWRIAESAGHGAPTRDESIRNFRRSAEGALGPQGTERMIGSVVGLADLPKASELFSKLAQPSPVPA